MDPTALQRLMRTNRELARQRDLALVLWLLARRLLQDAYPLVRPNSDDELAVWQRITTAVQEEQTP